MEIAKHITEEHEQLKIIWQYAEAPKQPKKNIPIGMPYMSLSDYKKSGATHYRREYLYQLAQMGSDELPVHWHNQHPVLTPDDFTAWQEYEKREKRGGPPPGTSLK